MSAKSISNVFKIFGAVSLAGLLSVASLQADEISEAQVTQAEQSTQEQKVDSASESKSINTNANASKANKSGAFGFCKGQHASTGCFIGASVGLAFGENWLSIPSTEILESSLEKNFVTVPVNIDFGWQWYYAQNAGFRFKGYVGYSNYNSDMGNVTYTDTSNPRSVKLTSHALQYGLEASYLYDFIYKGDHNFGAHISVGFEGTSFVGQSANTSNLGNAPFPSYSKFTWTSGVGIHYFYKVHHQFFLSYLYRGYTNSKSVASSASADGETDSQTGEFYPYVPANNYKLSTTPNSTIMLSYAYKF